MIDNGLLEFTFKRVEEELYVSVDQEYQDITYHVHAACFDEAKHILLGFLFNCHIHGRVFDSQEIHLRTVYQAKVVYDSRHVKPEPQTNVVSIASHSKYKHT